LDQHLKALEFTLRSLLVLIMQKIFSYFIITCFLIYWLITFLFTMPENYFRISFNSGDSFFQHAMFQQWSFFAPPPQSDDRLYYVIRNKETKKVIQTLEALEYVMMQKQKNAPFNQEETIIDYVISNSVNSLTESYRQQMEFLTYSIPDSSDVYRAIKSLDLVIESRDNDFQTLVNYGTLLLKKNKIEFHNSEFKIMVMQKPIIKFKDRLMQNSSNKEEVLVFESPYISVKI
jgi:hypothetical protein